MGLQRLRSGLDVASPVAFRFTFTKAAKSFDRRGQLAYLYKGCCPPARSGSLKLCCLSSRGMKAVVGDLEFPSVHFRLRLQPYDAAVDH